MNYEGFNLGLSQCTPRRSLLSRSIAFAASKIPLVVCMLQLVFLMINVSVIAQSRDLRPYAEYGTAEGELRLKYEYYHDMWSERDVKHGRFTEWNGNDKVNRQGYYFDGLQDSLWQYCYGNGKLKEVSEWDAGKRHGKTALYDKRGRLTKECTYKGGIQNGLAIIYFKNGKVRTIAQYHVGQ